MLIDSKNKKNRIKLEIFEVRGSFFGFGFRIAYLLLEKSNEEKRRMDSMKTFIASVKVKLRDLNQKAFFTDKEQGHMSCSKDVYGLRPSLCYWKMK